MQSSIVVMLMLCASVAASRVKVKLHSDITSSSQGACKVLAKWICQPKTYKENAAQVAKCCKASDVGDDKLRQACCQLAGVADEGSSAPATKTVAEKPVVVETPVEEVVIEDEDVADEVADEVVESSPKHVQLADEDHLAGIWKNIEITPDVSKTLVKAFHAAKHPDLSWAMSCAAECEESCEGECQPVQTHEDCEAAADQLSKTFFAYDPAKSYLAKEMKRFPRGCFVKSGKSNSNAVRWNPPTFDAPTVKLNNVCGCYK